MSAPRAIATVLKTHLHGKLNAQMAESADTQDGDEIPSPSAAVTERIERGYTGTHQWRGFYG